MSKIFKSGDLPQEKNEDYLNTVISNFLSTPIGFKSKNSRPILIPISKGHTGITKYLLGKGCTLSPIHLDQNGQNCLELAIKKGHTEVFNILLNEIGIIKQDKKRMFISEFDSANMLLTLTLSFFPLTPFLQFVKVLNHYYIY